MNIVMAGGTGFVGKALTNDLLSRHHTVYILTRNPAKMSTSHPNLHFVEWLRQGSEPEKQLPKIDAFINLAGESLNSGRWTKARKKQIIDSRLAATKEIIRIISTLDTKPEVLLNASAIGIYGTSLREEFTEESSAIGDDFLARTVKAWEVEALRANNLGVRTVLARFGVILGKDAGALPRMITPYRFFVGGTVGTGKQWLSWIHIHDVIRSLEFMLQHKDVVGPVNVTAPNPMQMKSFGETIGRVISRPHWLPVPGFALQLLLGQMSILVLEGQRVLPDKLQRAGFTFTYTNLDNALQDLLQ